MLRQMLCVFHSANTTKTNWQHRSLSRRTIRINSIEKKREDDDSYLFTLDIVYLRFALLKLERLIYEAEKRRAVASDRQRYFGALLQFFSHPN